MIEIPIGTEIVYGDTSQRYTAVISAVNAARITAGYMVFSRKTGIAFGHAERRDPYRIILHADGRPWNKFDLEAWRAEMALSRKRNKLIQEICDNLPRLQLAALDRLWVQMQAEFDPTSNWKETT